MSLAPFFASISASDAAAELSRTLKEGSVSVRGAAGSLPAFLAAHIGERLKRPVLVILEEPDDAAYFCSDVRQVLAREEGVLLFPPPDKRSGDAGHMPDPEPVIARGEVLQALEEDFSGILVSSIHALTEKVPPRSTVRDAAFDLSVNDTVDPEDLIERLVTQGFTRTEFVEAPGDLALRGGILDVFPFSGSYPVRIEFFGDEVDSIREFDIHTQRSVSRKSTTRIVPNLEAPIQRDTDEPSDIDPHADWVSILDYLPTSTVVMVQDAQRLYEQVAEAGKDEAAVRAALAPYATVHMGSFQEADSGHRIDFGAQPQPSFSSRIATLRQRLSANSAAGMKTTILCDNRGQETRLQELLAEEISEGRLDLRVDSLHEGFEMPAIGLALYTDHQIFDRYHRPTARRQKQRYGGLSLRELHHLTPGDFVVHIDYGVGRFAGMEQIEVRGRQQEAVRLNYLSGDTLYVNVNALHKLHKYKGKEGHQPQLTKLGSGQWEKTKSRTKARVKDIARELIQLYAERKASDGFAFSPDTVWQQELEASFEFEDTPDQASATAAVKADMEEPVPMDRLVCGDVGFGKTEIAVRAAFKAVQDGKQVAILVPTTVLAAQHYRTFAKRMTNFPVQIGILSRFQSAADIKETLRKLKAGQLDIVVGTHRLISKDVEFNDLGLLIIDEEQRFGVSVKEKLRRLRVNVDTLTLTATPIPRTLQFSLLGARDLSIMSTPPPNRQSIITEIHTFDKDLIRDALLQELGRGGQVFFIHNRVQSIQELADTLRMIVPDVRIRTAHGQMKGADLERVMMDFVEGRFDVLVSTSIIENGLDISNANTIIINRADHFGLAELHQLRGRVGRSDRKAFCYLLVPTIQGLTREARQRLQAVEEFTELGSGVHLAMRDLDIRGAGNLLGAEQSGFVEDVGFETYHRILDEAVEELRTSEFAELFKDGSPPRPQETTVDIDADALIPDAYLSNRVERLNMYRRISEAANVENLAVLRDEMIDRFGPLPDEVRSLFSGVELKLEAEHLRLPRVIFKNERLFLTVPDPEQDPWFFEHLFQPFLGALSELDHRYVLKETASKKLQAIVQDVPDMDVALGIVSALRAGTGTLTLSTVGSA
ncbi:MAG: transcription-repair coupling factor [Rhodothermales bacterium]